MNILHTLESQYGFTYPAIYHQMYADNMLSYGVRGPDWEKTVMPRLIEVPPLLFYCNDFELVLPEQIVEAREEFYIPVPYRQVPEGANLIPFGETGGGDLYCFDIGGSQDELPVVLAAHDSSRVETVAENLQAFVYQNLVAMIVGVEEDSAVMQGDFCTNVANMLKTHGRYLTEGQRETLAKVFGEI